MNKRLQYYNEFVDDLVELLEFNVIAIWVSRGKWGSTSDQDRFEPFLSGLNDGQRTLVAQIAQDAREDAIFDVIKYLYTGMESHSLNITRNGVELAFEPYGTETYYDWTARKAGDNWPDHQVAPEYRSDDDPSIDDFQDAPDKR